MSVFIRWMLGFIVICQNECVDGMMLLCCELLEDHAVLSLDMSWYDQEHIWTIPLKSSNTVIMIGWYQNKTFLHACTTCSAFGVRYINNSSSLMNFRNGSGADREMRCNGRRGKKNRWNTSRRWLAMDRVHDFHVRLEDMSHMGCAVAVIVLLHLLSGFQWLKVNDGYLLWLGVPDFVKLYNCPPWKVTFEDMAAWYLYHNLLEGPLGMAFVSIQEYVWHEMTLNHFRCGSKSWDRHSTSLATIWGMFHT